ncbi:ArsR/SmtB family transcription factor [Mesorhizobium sp. ORM8.1]
MTAYVRQRLAEIGADPALRRGPINAHYQRNLAAELLSGLGYRIRLLTIVHLLDRERSVADLVSRIKCSQATLSQHLGKLLEVGIVEGRYHGGRRYYSCKSHEAKEVVLLLDRLASNEMIPSGAGDDPSLARLKRR